MSIFKKTVKYSKASKDLDSKIKSLDEGLKKTGVISEQNDAVTFCVEEKQEENILQIIDKLEVVKKEEKLYNWRETFLEENIEEEILEENYEIPSLTRVENYISESNKDLILIRDQIFKEISENTLLDLPEIKNKISKVLEIYEQLQEGLLNEPPETKNEDPLTPFNQNFVTAEDLNKHYTLFINRIQEQLATVGGGGETRLKYLDDIVGIATNASLYDGKFLKYDHTLGKFVFEAVSSGGGSGDYASIAGIATYASTAGVSTYATSSGVSTYAATAGVSTYASTSGIATYAQSAGIATSAGTATTATNLADAANILTGTINKDRISTTNALTVLGDLYVSNNISFGGTTTQLNTEQLNIVDPDIVLGIGTTFSPSDNTANHGGIAIASTEGSPLVDLNIVPGETNPTTYKKIMWFKGDSIGVGLTDAWLFNYAVGIGSTQVPNGVRLAVGNIRLTDNTVTATTFSGSLSGNATSSTYATTAGVSTTSETIDITNTNGLTTIYYPTFVENRTTGQYLRADVDLTYRTDTNTLTVGGGFVGNLTGTASTAQGLTGTPNINVGIVTSTISIPTQLRTQSVAEKTTLINGNTVGLAFSTGGGNVAICTNPSADITLSVTGIPTDSSFDNHSISFSVIVTQSGTARTCTAVNLNGVSRTIRWAGGSLSNALSGISTNNGYDIFTFTGINTVGSASTTANYVVLGSVNGGFN
jgi:hypothetical protein